MKKSMMGGLDEGSQQEKVQAFKEAARFRDNLTAHLRRTIEQKAKKGRSEDMYSSPNWLLTQADINGQIRALEFCISLLQD